MPAVEVFYDATGPLSAPTWAKLNASIAASDTTLTVITVPANNPTANTTQMFRIMVANSTGGGFEQMLVTATSGTTWTVTRGVSGAAATHSANADVLPVLAAGSFNATGRLAATAAHEIAVSGALVGTRQRINLMPGSGVGITGLDNPGAQSVDVTVTASGGGSAGLAVQQSGVTLPVSSTLNFVGGGVSVSRNDTTNAYDVTVPGGTGTGTGGGTVDATMIQVNTPAGPQTLQQALTDIYAQLSELATFN